MYEPNYWMSRVLITALEKLSADSGSETRTYILVETHLGTTNNAAL